MAHREHAVDQFNADTICLTEQVTLPPGTSGRLKMSGAKLYIDDGTDWDLVTST